MTDPTTPPPPPPPASTSEPQPSQPSPTPKEKRPRLPIKTYHCRFCNHLLLASTRDIHSLPRRRSPPAADGALILPLPPQKPSVSASASDSESESEPEPEGLTPQRKKEGRRQEHYTILLSTTLPDRKTTIVRREDGFEKRLLLRCGRCRVVVGYLLDEIHFPKPVREVHDHDHDHDQEGDKGNGDGDDEAKVAYLLPGALVRTEEMGDEARKAGMDAEWMGWVR